MRNFTKFALPGVLTIAFLMRLVGLNQSLWLDEATSALVAKMSLSDMFTKFLPADFHPPFYYLVLKFWVSLFGSSEISLRIPSVIFGLGIVWLVFLITRDLFDKKVAEFAALLSATSGLLIYYSQEARMYSMAAFLVSLSIYLFISRKWLWFSLVLLLIGMTDYVSLLILPVFWLATRKNRKEIFISHIPLVIIFGFWAPFFIKQLRSGVSLAGSAWWQLLGPATFKNFFLIPVKFIWGRISFDNKLVYEVIVLVASLLFSYLLYLARRSPKILWMWFVTPIVLGVLLSFKIPTLSYFRFLFCLPALYILVSSGVFKLNKLRNLLISLMLTINILSSAYYLFEPRFHREDWRAATIAIGNEKIVLPANSQKEALIYYGKSGQIISVNQIGKEDNEVWLSRYVWEIFDPMDSVRKKIEILGYNKASEYDFNGVVFWKYIKK